MTNNDQPVTDAEIKQALKRAYGVKVHGDTAGHVGGNFDSRIVWAMENATWVPCPVRNDWRPVARWVTQNGLGLYFVTYKSTDSETIHTPVEMMDHSLYIFSDATNEQIGAALVRAVNAMEVGK